MSQATTTTEVQTLTADQEEAAGAICERLSEIVGADVLNSYPSDQAAVDASLSRFAGQSVVVKYS